MPASSNVAVVASSWRMKLPWAFLALLIRSIRRTDYMLQLNITVDATCPVLSEGHFMIGSTMLVIMFGEVERLHI